MAMVVVPEPQLDATLYSGGETEGWVGFLVGKGEGNMMLAVNESLNFDEDAIRYIALDDGASVKVSPDLATITPNGLGKERQNPAAANEQIVTDDWEFSILEVIRGDEAWRMVQEANQFNEPPASGMEYITVKIHARYIGTEDKAQSINGSFFKSTGSANVAYDSPSVVGPSPSLDIYLYPGGEFEGWVVVQAAVSESEVSLVFEPTWDISSSSERFIALE
jgi:hypothetical protein